MRHQPAQLSLAAARGTYGRTYRGVRMRQATDAPAGPHEPGPCPGLPAVPDLAAIEHEVLGRWASTGVLRRSLARSAGGPPWTCYENPPVAAGMPGIHHVRGLAVRDLYLRLKAMQGFDVCRGSGYSCHGLPVEVAVEKELGLSGGPDIDAYGPERFAARCRESALRHADAMSALSTRVGNWTDSSHGYLTMDASYIESVWWSLRQFFDAGLLRRGRQVAPYCPRCQTVLSGPDLGQPGGDRNVAGTGVIVRFPIADAARRRQPPAARRPPARLDDGAVDAGRQRRDRGAPAPELRAGPAGRPRRPGHRGRAAGRRVARRGLARRRQGDRD